MYRIIHLAHGVALAGRVEGASSILIDGQASATLPTIGGRSAAEVKDFSLPGIVSASSLVTRCEGFANGAESYGTTVTVSVRDLQVLDLLRAEEVTVRLTAMHPGDGSRPRIVPVGTRLVGLRIADRSYDPHLNVDTLTEGKPLERIYYGEEGGRAPAGGGGGLWGPAERPDEPRVIREHAPVSGEYPPGLYTYTGKRFRRIHVPSLGTIFIGDLAVSAFSHRLTLLRIQLRGLYNGELVIAEAECGNTRCGFVGREGTLPKAAGAYYSIHRDPDPDGEFGGGGGDPAPYPPPC